MFSFAAETMVINALNDFYRNISGGECVGMYLIAKMAMIEGGYKSV